jgi:hypothetical protein
LYTSDEEVLAHPSLHLVAREGQGTQGSLVTRKNVNDPLMRAFFDAPSRAATERFTFAFEGGSWIGSARIRGWRRQKLSAMEVSRARCHALAPPFKPQPAQT